LLRIAPSEAWGDRGAVAVDRNAICAQCAARMSRRDGHECPGLVAKCGRRAANVYNIDQQQQQEDNLKG
jgi:hypothetical protein